jgi:hypothetical protein
MKDQALLRLARRALKDSELLSLEDRAQLFEDVALILPREEARVAKDTALAIRRSIRMQQDFLLILK